jgi:hypothetical protein
LLAAAATLFSVTSCKKDDDSNSTPAPTKLQLLTGHSWRMNQAFADGVDVTNFFFHRVIWTTSSRMERIIRTPLMKVLQNVFQLTPKSSIPEHGRLPIIKACWS